MNSKKVVSPNILPTRLPITQTLIVILAIEVFEITGIWLGVIITLLILLWIASILLISREKRVDIFAPNKATKEDIEAMVDNIVKRLEETKRR